MMIKVIHAGAGLIALIVLIALLNLSLSFHNLWPTPWITARFEISVEAALIVLVLALLAWRGRRLSSGPATVLAWLVLLMIAGRYADVTAPALYGRPINLYWDSQHFPGVVAMLARVASWWQLTLAGLGIVLIIGGLIRGLRALLTGISIRLEPPVRHRSALVASAALITLFGMGLAGQATPMRHYFSHPVLLSFGTQVFRLYQAMSDQTRLDLQANPVLKPDLELIKNANVLVMFIESYGVTTLDKPAHAQALLPARERLTKAITDSGRQVVSTRVQSPTYGGGSWLAHSSFLSAYPITDQPTYQQLLASQRETWVKSFADRGYRTVGLLPGIRLAWPEGAYYGFDQIYDAQALAYTGPEFGWWRIPDQYSLAKAVALEDKINSQTPVMMFFTTISSHAPFRPIAPYVENWQTLADAPYATESSLGQLDELLAAKPDWSNLAPAYLDSVSYALTVLAGFLSEPKDREQIVIVIGDHQPAASVTGPDASWAVPVHVIAPEPLLTQLSHNGFAPGLTPVGPTTMAMHKLTNQLLSAFSQTSVDIPRTVSDSQ